jgi:hypothetical protein
LVFELFQLAQLFRGGLSTAGFAAEFCHARCPLLGPDAVGLRLLGGHERATVRMPHD